MEANEKRTYTDFELRAWKSAPGQVQVLVQRSPAGDMRQPAATGFDETELQKLMQASFTSSGLTQAMRLGAALAQILLPEPVRDLLDRSLDQLGAAEGLRVRLCLDPALADIPWEFLLRLDTPEQNQLRGFLVLDPRISVVREAPRTVNPAPPPAGRQRLVFFAMADASPGLKLEEEYQQVTDALKPCAAYLEVVRPPIAAASLGTAFDDGAAILHYTGWAYAKDGRGYLAGTAGAQPHNPQPWSDPVFRQGLIACDELGPLLQQAGTRLVALSTCHSADWVHLEPFMRFGMPAAIGIAGQVLGDECIAFFSRLYTALGVGLSLDEAVSWARLHLLEPGVLGGRTTDVWGQFVVYMPTADPVLLPQLALPETMSSQQSMLQQGQNTVNAAKHKLWELLIDDVESVDLAVTITSENKVRIKGLPLSDLVIPPDLEQDLEELRDHDVLSEARFQELGSRLFAALFTGKLAARYRNQLKAARKDKKILRIALTLDSPLSLLAPWEYLFYKESENGLFLAGSRETALRRCVDKKPAEVDHPLPLKDGEQLRVLAVISNPHDLNTLGFAPLDFAKESGILREALTPPGRTAEGPIRLEFLDGSPSLTNINNKLGDFKPHILHIVGHGTLEDGKFKLALADESNATQLHDAVMLAKSLTLREELRAVALVACQSGAPEIGSALAGLAPTLLRSGIPAVLVMQHSIVIETAQHFVQQFYHALRMGYPIDYAVNLARFSLHGELPDRRAFGTPVLYAMTPQLFAAAQTAAAPKDNPRSLKF